MLLLSCRQCFSAAPNPGSSSDLNPLRYEGRLALCFAIELGQCALFASMIRSCRWRTHLSTLHSRVTVTGGISGAIASDEVPLAFIVLGMNLKKHEVHAVVEEFNKDNPIVCTSLLLKWLLEDRNVGLNFFISSTRVHSP